MYVEQDYVIVPSASILTWFRASQLDIVMTKRSVTGKLVWELVCRALAEFCLADCLIASLIVVGSFLLK